MNMTATIVSIISLVACLYLATRGAPFAGLGTGKTIRLAAIWVAIIIGLVLVIQLTGFSVQN